MPNTIGVPLVGGYPFTASITVDLYGNPGPLNSDGLPVSLDGFLGAGGDITAEPGYHYGFSFQGDFSGQPQVQAVPEPPPLLAAATAVIGTAAAAGFRSRRAIGR